MKDPEEGAGETRVGTNLKLSPDLYSMLFATTMYSEYLTVLKEKAEERAGLLDKLVEEEAERPS